MFAMKFRRFIIFLVCAILSGCASIKQASDERKVAATSVGDDFYFKTWPSSSVTRSLKLKDVSETSTHLGPDFTVHYFSFEEGAGVSLYNGGHSRWNEDAKVASAYQAPFGDNKTKWRIFTREKDVRAETLVSEAEFSHWHVTIIAPTRNRVESIIRQMSSFKSTSSEQDIVPNL